MAQKNRKQVNLDALGKVAANPLIAPVGGTAQTVIPPVPTENSAQRITKALNQLPNLLGQTANINMDLGREAAEELTAEEINEIIEGKIPAPDGGIIGKLGFEKAFEETFAKRYADTTGIERYSSLENSLQTDLDEFVKRGASLGTVTTHVNQEVKKLQEELMSNFEDGNHGRKVMNLITGELSSRIIAGATKGYEKKRLAYMRSVKSESVRNKFTEVLDKNITLKDYIANADKELKQAGFSNEEINSSLRTAAVDGLEVLKDSGRLKQAFALHEDLEGLNINNRLFFGSLSDRKALAQIGADLVRADKSQSSAESLSEPIRAFTGLSDNAYRSLHSYDVASKDELNRIEVDLENDFKDMYEVLQPMLGEEIGDAWAKDLLEKLKPIRGMKSESAPLMDRALQNLVRGLDIEGNKLGTGEPSDRSETIYRISYSNVMKNLQEFRNASRFETLEGITDDDLTDIALAAQLFAEENLQASPKTWWRSTEWGESGNIMPKQVREAFDKAKEINWLLINRVEGNLIDEGARLFKKNLDTTIRSEIAKTNANETAKATLKEQQVAMEVLFKEELDSKLRKAARILNQPNEAGLVLSQEEKINSIKEITQDLINTEQENFKSVLKQQREFKKDKDAKAREDVGLDINPDEVLTGSSVIDRTFIDEPNFPKYESLSFDNKLEDSLKYSKLLRDPNATQEELEETKASFMGNVNVDIKNARAGISSSDTKALAYILRIHGYPKFDAKFVAKDLEKAEQSWAEIRLFKDLSEIEDWQERFQDVINTSLKRNNLEVEELVKRNVTEEIQPEQSKRFKEDFELMLELGIYDQEILNDFLEIQKSYFYQR
tara:strand:- start:6032 stop:8545 length:2514 start_codon:yes stop_codon:yes gene_type:complete